MSHPEQPYGQKPQPGQHGGQPQPGPYGGQPQPGPYGGQPPPGHYGAPPPPGFQGYPPGADGSGPRPPRKRTALITAVTIGAVVLAVVGITGFVAPGFFLAGRDGAGTTAQEDRSDSKAFLTDLIEAANEKDVGKMRDLACAKPGRNVQPAIRYVGSTNRFALTNSKLVSDKKLSAFVDITFAGSSDTGKFEFTAIKDRQDWCWYDIVNRKPAGATAKANPDLGKGMAFAKDVLRKVNAKDATALKGMLCKDSRSRRDVDEVTGQNPRLRVDTTHVTVTADAFGIDLEGTLDGKPTSAGRISGFLEDDGWCLFTIYAFA